MFSRNYRSNVENVGVSDRDGDFDIVYYNADIINNNINDVNNRVVGFVGEPTIQFKETRTKPILKNSQNYEFSIVRFQIDGANKNLPLFIPQIRIGQSNINLTIYRMFLKFKIYYTDPLTLQVNNIDAIVEQEIIYEPSNKTYGTNAGGGLSFGPLPNAPTKQVDLSSDYYFVYAYDHWVTIINKTFVELYEKVKVGFAYLWTIRYGPLPQPTIITKVPFMVYEPSTNLFSIYYDTYGFGGKDALSYNNGVPIAGTEEFEFSANSAFYGLFSSFNTVYQTVSETTGTKGSQYTYIVENKLNTNIWTPNSFTTFPALAPSYYKMTQNYPNTSSMWSPISSIVFTSQQLGVLNEYTSAPLLLGRSNINNDLTSGNFNPIITDMAYNLKSSSDYCNLLFHEPNGEFKMATMLGGSNNSLNNIDINVFWKNRLDNQLYPIRMFPNSNVSIKMMFRKKKY